MKAYTEENMQISSNLGPNKKKKKRAGVWSAFLFSIPVVMNGHKTCILTKCLKMILRSSPKSMERLALGFTVLDKQNC